MSEPGEVTSDGGFTARRRRAVRLTPEALVRTGYLSERRLPLVVEPNAEGLNLAAWAGANRGRVEDELNRHGAILFRGFGVESVAQFEAFVNATSDGALEYRERSSPRSQVSGHIYTSTDYPEEQSIFLHNEQSYNTTFPLRIYFFCLTPARSGGATPVADTRRIFRALSPATRDLFLRRRYMYVRNFGDGFGLSWQNAFQTESRAEVEDYCRRNDIAVEWKPGNRLRTRQVRAAAARHPRTGEPAWFNHATFFHVNTLAEAVRRRVLAEFGPDDLPNNTYFGDGEPIPDAVTDELRAAYLAEKVAFEWAQGDVLMLDNMLAAHGREPFEGPRKVVAGMADPCGWKDVETENL